MERITSVKNPVVQKLRALKTRKGRVESGLFLVEGEVMLQEALRAGYAPLHILKEESIVGFPEALVVTREILESVCDTKTPQGICAAFVMPHPANLDAAPDKLVALDGVQDPGNVGTIIRTADAAGFAGILFGAQCADPFSPKVQRSAMGSGFRMPFFFANPLAQALCALRARGYTVYGSSLAGSDFYRREKSGEKFILVIGSEAHGISGAVADASDFLLRLPMRGKAESLNAAVAAGIMMYEMMRE